MHDQQIHGSAPFFIVADVVKAAEFYRDVLGFDLPRFWGEPPCFAMPRRDGFVVMLQQADDPARVHPNGGAKGCESWDAYFWVRDADALFAEFSDHSVEVVYPPTDQEYYGMREFAIRDLDGYILAFAHDTGEQAPDA